MKVIEIKGAEPFLKALSLDNKNINGVLLKPIFRGQSDANWAALPSAYRDDGNLLLDRKLYPLGVRTNREQIEAEFYTLSLLVDELNQNGFHVPNEEILNLDTNSNEFNEFITKIGRGESIWPPKKYHSLMSIAQHYGMPTRLLDFTYDPYVALYFAVKGVLEGVNSDYLAVYVVNKFNPKLTGYDFIENYESDGLYKKNVENRIYQVIKSPSSFNDNLRSQKGLFLASVEKTFYSNDPFEPYSLDDYLGEFGDQYGSYKFIIKSQYAEELMRLLQNRFYSASSIFPSIEGCVQSVYEKNKAK